MPGSYKTAIDNLATDQCRIMFVGDSLLEGQGATSQANRGQQRILTKINARYDLASSGNGQYKPFYFSGGEPVSASWGRYGTRSSESGGIEDDSTYSVGNRGYIIYANNYWSLPTQTFRYIEVQYTESGDLGLGNMQLVDITDPGNPIFVGLPFSTATGGPGTRPGKRFFHDFGSLTTRTVGIYCNNNGIIVDGVTMYTSTPTTGVTILDSTAAGAASSAATSGSASWIGWQNMDADLVIDDLWHNDFLASAATPSVSAARMGERIDRYRAIRSDIDIVTIMVWDLPTINGTTTNSLSYTLDQYRSAIRQICRDKNVWILDLSRYQSATADLLVADQIHPNDNGHELFATIVDTFIAGVAEGNQVLADAAAPAAAYLGATRVDRVYHGSHLLM